MASQQCRNKIMLNDTLFKDLLYSESLTGRNIPGSYLYLVF